MDWAEWTLVVAVLATSVWLARGAGLAARTILLLSSLVVSAGLFLPSATLRASAGPGVLASLSAAIGLTQVEALAHLVLFTWLALCVWLLRPDIRGWKAVLALLLLAVAAELMQSLTGGRSTRMDDIALNLLGVGTGILAAVAVRGGAYLYRRLQIRPAD